MKYLISNVIIFSVYIVVSNANFMFLNSSYTENDWNILQNTFQCWSNTGVWKVSKSIHHTNHFYFNPCNTSDIDHVYGCENENRIEYHLDITSKCSTISTDTLSTNSKMYSYTNFNSHHFCSILKDRTILFVGDSLTQEFYFTFLFSFGISKCPPIYDMKVDCSSILEESDNFESQSFRALFIRNDKLSVNHPYYENVNEWITTLIPENISLLIMNRGAHYVDDHEFAAEIEYTFENLKSFINNGNGVIFRSTVPGHGNFSSYFYSKPLEIAQQYDDSSQYIDLKPEWHYKDFQRQNQIVKDLIYNRFQSIIYMDIYPFTVLRADGHVDNIHYCIPGPLHEWIRMLYNILHTLNHIN